MNLNFRKALCCSLLGISAANCPCTKIGENDFGQVRMGNEHPDQSGLTKFYAHVDTPVGHEQQEDYAFLLKFSEPVTGFTQHFATDNAEDGTDSVIITPGQNRISGDPYTFNFDGLVENGNVETEAWYCESSEEIEESAGACFGESGGEPESAGEPEAEPEPESVNVPDWDCDQYDRCVVKYNVNMTIGDAREACQSHHGSLPRPRNELENEQLATIGSTWLELYVNEKIDMKYENFAPRQRAYLNAENDAMWDVEHGSEALPFFCVRPAPEGCHNFFRSEENGNDLFGNGDGEWRVDTDEGYRQFTQEDADGYDADFRFELGTVLQYRCPHKLQFYKPWRKPSKVVQIKCLRMENGDLEFGECNNRKCKMFNRRPWLNERLFGQTFSVGGIGAASTRSQLFC